MGWPDDTIDLRHYYPTTLLITGFDIIFFWVARMIMLGLKFGGDVPFRDVYITSLVRDEHGQKMSKSKGNVVDPLEIIDRIGADAFRFTLAALASPGMDIALSEGRMKGYRQFVNKIWNASRFVLMNADSERFPLPDGATLPVVDRWILHRLDAVTREFDAALREYRFDVAADLLYHFFWHEYADWYIELAKPRLAPGVAGRRDAVAVLVEVHDHILRLLHPMMPFVTEELWQHLPKGPDAAPSITLAAFPVARPERVDERAAAAIALVQEVVTTIRTARAERGVPPAKRASAIVEGATADHRRVLEGERDHVMRLAGLDAFDFAEDVPRERDTVRRVVREMQIHVPLAGIVNRDAEKARILKDLAGVEKQRAGLIAKLANPMFRERADSDVVRETESQVETLGEHHEKLTRILQELGG
jgi:valyl-tRNA synthetase